MNKIGMLVMALFLFVPHLVFANAEDDLQKANDAVVAALQAVQQGDLVAAKQRYETFSSTWYDIEDGIKKKSKTTYRSIEDAMGEVTFAFLQQPVSPTAVQTGLQKLSDTNMAFLAGKTGGAAADASNGKSTVTDIVALLNGALADMQSGDYAAARAKMEIFRKSWLDVEGVVVTQSSKVYADTERDMVSAYAYLSATPPDVEKAQATIRMMRDYLLPLAGKSSYSILDATTILLREGLEALLVVVALLSFMRKSGNGDKRRWIWYGVGSGLGVSIILGIIIQLLFSSGAFGSNNFLIAGVTGLFAGVMLLYMSYWLHSKSSLSNWQQYIRSQSTRALASGSLVSLAVLAFLAVFREGTETVLFFIGMASSIDLGSLLGGIGIGIAALVVISYLMIKVGMRIPIRPFFLVSSILVFYLCFKFVGMGVHGLQMAGILQATQTEWIRPIDALAIYPTMESLIPQAALLVFAAATIVWTRMKDRRVRNQLAASDLI